MYDYAPGSQEKKELDVALQKFQSQVYDIPIVVGDEEIRTQDVKYQVAVSILRLH